MVKIANFWAYYRKLIILSKNYNNISFLPENMIDFRDFIYFSRIIDGFFKDFPNNIKFSQKMLIFEKKGESLRPIVKKKYHF